MVYSVRFTALALAEIDSHLAWLSTQSSAAAARWHQRLLEAIQSLETNPERCSLAPENDWYSGELRQLLYGKKRGVYRILFEVRGDIVYVLRVRHGAQDLLEPGDL